MKSKCFFFLFIAMINLSFHSCAMGGTFPIHLQYQPGREFLSLQQKLGATLGIAPFKDDRSDTLYIGHHTSRRGISSYFQSDPFPLEIAIEKSIHHFLSRYGVKVISAANWDGKPESLKNMGTDSVLMVEIKRFWAEGKGETFRTKVRTSIYLTIHLGVKQDRKIFSKNIYVNKEENVSRLTPQGMEQIINQALTEIFNSFFSDPYGHAPTSPGVTKGGKDETG